MPEEKIEGQDPPKPAKGDKKAQAAAPAPAEGTPKVTKRKDGFFEVEGLRGYYTEETANRVAAQVAAGNAAKAAKTKGK